MKYFILLLALALPLHAQPTLANSDDIAGLQTAINGKVATTSLSTTGGASKVLQADSNGDWHLSPVTNNNLVLDPGGNIFFSDKRGIKFTNQAGTIVGSLDSWGDHNVSPLQNEIVFTSLGRIALAAEGGLQTAPNNSARMQRYMEFNSGYATNARVDETRMPSEAAIFQTKTWNGSASVQNDISMQAVPLDGTGTNSILRLWDRSSMLDSITGNPDATLGNITGTPIAEIYKDGIWSNGTAPPFTSLTAVSNVFTQACSKYKTVQISRLNLGATNTLAISGALDGMRGVIYATQDATGSRSITLPTGSMTPGGVALSLSGANKTDRLAWEYDSGVYYWTLAANLSAPLDTDAATFLTNSSNSGDSTVSAAINSLVVSLKNSGTTPNTLWELTYRFWPFVGGTSTKHNYELKSASVLGAFSSTGISHTSNGITGDGVNGFMRTGFVPSSASSAQNSIGVFVYNRTTLPTEGGAFICGYGTGGIQVGIERYGINLKKLGLNTNDTSQFTDESSNFKGLLFANRSASNAEQWGKVGGNENAGTITSTSNCDTQIALLGRYDYGSTYDHPSNANLAAALITQSLDSTQRAALKTIIDTFQTALGGGRANP